jgi:hypothetical protein
VTADGAMTTTAGLAPYSGPGGRCPKCQVPCAASTEWYWAAVALAPREQPRGRAPACGELGLLGMPVEGEHLCRLCGNCGYGWAEACLAPARTPRGVTVPAPDTAAPPGSGVPPLAVLLFSPAVSLAGTAAGSFLGPQLSGAALVAAWLAATVAIAVVIAAGHAAAAGRAGKGSSR